MMLNNLFLHRLLITTENGLTAYDEKFHKGVNIIRGHNSSGKSTITHFIFYALGGDFTDFVPEATKCSTVFAEVEANQATFTIRRELEKDDDGRIKKRSAMYFYWGDLNESLNPPEDKSWQRFGYDTRDNRKSFSNVLFDNLGLPIVKGDNNITFHQILRLLYIDQESPTNSLFYYEHFDSQLTRETVSELLMGIYDEKLYANRKRLIAAQKELDETKAELKATRQFFQDPLTLNPAHIKSQIENKRREISEIEKEIIEIRTRNKQIELKDNSKLLFQKLNDQAIEKRSKVLKIENEISQLEYEIEDSQYFIETLNSKRNALLHSIQTRDFLGGLTPEFCPECLSRIKKSDKPNQCSLCKETIDDSYGIVQARRMQLEVDVQISESNKILDFNKRKLLELQAKYESDCIALIELQRQVDNSLVDVKSTNQEEMDGLLQTKGFFEGEIIQFETLLENAELYSRLLKKEYDLNEEVKMLRHYVFSTEQKQIQLKKSITESITQAGVYLLNNDLERQDEFKYANEFFIDFSNNITYLSNRYSKYSASSNFYLKVSARFAIFFASLFVENMRFPRFLFADNMEDKGIEEKRAQNLQKIIIEKLGEFNSDSYQLIYTTSYITEELNNSDLVVGDFYTKESPSLKNV